MENNLTKNPKERAIDGVLLSYVLRNKGDFDQRCDFSNIRESKVKTIKPQHMHITELRIRNFRNFKKARFKFQEGVNTLIGENGSGKTNVFHAMRLLLDESLSRNALNLRDSDFCRALESWKGHWIVISIDFSNLDPAEGTQLLRHQAAHMDDSNTGTLTFYFRPKREVRNELHSRSLIGGTIITEYQDSLTVDDYEGVLRGRSSADFLDNAVYASIAGNPESNEFPDPEDENQEATGIPVYNVFQEVACTFVRALRDVVSELHGQRNNPLLTLLRGMEKNLNIAESEGIINKVTELNDEISDLDEVRDLAEGIGGALNKAVGNTYGADIEIRSSLPGSIDALLQRLSVLVGDEPNTDYRGEIHEQSLGGANLIYLALKLLEYEMKLSSDRVAHFLLIEEPEAHIHTHIQKTLFSNLPGENTQVFVSTHSTQISSAAKISKVNILSRSTDHAEVYQPSNGLDPKLIPKIERYLDAVRTPVLFAKGVILVEGDAEQILIPALLKAVFGVTPDELGFSLISMNSAFFENIATIFHQDRIQRPCAILTDWDQAFVDLPDNYEDDDEQERKARNSQESGAIRKEKLDTFCDGNDWVTPFYTKNTFEVDFSQYVSNEEVIISTLDSIYQQKAARTRSAKKIQSSNIAVYGTEVLRLANDQGKGWFAILLSDQVSAKTSIPDYIIDALAFILEGNISSATLRKMAEYRLSSSDGVDEDWGSAQDAIGALEVPTHQEYLDVFFEHAPEEDSLVLLRNAISELST